MTIFNKIYELSKKLSQALLDNKDLSDLEEADFFSDDAKKHIVQKLSNEEIKENLELLNKIDKEADWKKIEDKISGNPTIKQKRHVSISSFYKVAIAAVFLISLTYIAFNSRTHSTQGNQESVSITMGTDKAILTLEDGLDIVLDKGTPFKNGTAHSNGERLEYNSAKGNSKTVFNYLTIPKGGQYQILLSDSTLVWLNSDTKLKYPVTFKKGEPRTVELLYGEAYFDVSPSSKHQGRLFKVLTKMQEVEVVGTEFNIKAYDDEEHIYTTLVEGKVNIVVGNKAQQLRPGEQSILKIDTKHITKHKVYVDYDIAWVRGYFNFKDKPLTEIMKVLSRWYDVDITFESQSLKAVKFSGLLSKTQNIEDILNGIKNTKFINAYDIEDKTISIK